MAARLAYIAAVSWALCSAYETEQRDALGAIPQDKLDALTPGATMANLRAAASINTPSESSFSSTYAQDKQKCRVMRLPDDINLTPEYASWARRSGDWSMANGVKLASWAQNLFAQHWETVYLKNIVDGGNPSVKAPAISAEQMMRGYGFEAINASSVTSKYMPLLDCEGKMMFVVREEQEEPHRMQIYGKHGELVADTITDLDIWRVQFTDPKSGYLLATAESPAIYANVSKQNMVADHWKGSILPWAIHFETGGYPNASLLMEDDWRWVMATAIQVHATREPQRGGQSPHALYVLWFISWVVVGLCMLAAVLICYFLYQTVYPAGLWGDESKWLRVPTKDLVRPGMNMQWNKYV